MAGFTSYDNMINNVSSLGKLWRTDFSKQFNPTTAAAQSEWHTLFRGGGNPQADAIFDASGVNLQYNPVYDFTTSGGSMWNGGNVNAAYTDFKVILNAAIGSSATTTMPATAMLVDVLGFHRVTTVTTTTAQTTVNSNTFVASSSSGLLLTYANDWADRLCVRFTNSGGALPTGLSTNTDYWLIRVSATTARVATSLGNAIAGTAIAFTDAGTGTHTLTIRHARYGDGTGVFNIMFNPAATALGAGTPNLTVSYTNVAGTASRTTPTSPSAPVGKTAASNSLILYSGTGAGKFGPFLPLQVASDLGVQSIQSITNSTSYVSGQYCVAYVKPLVTLPMTTVGVTTYLDFTTQLMSAPRVYDGAALYWLINSTALTPVNSAFNGQVTFGWS